MICTTHGWVEGLECLLLFQNELVPSIFVFWLISTYNYNCKGSDTQTPSSVHTCTQSVKKKKAFTNWAIKKYVVCFKIFPIYPCLWVCVWVVWVPSESEVCLLWSLHAQYGTDLPSYHTHMCPAWSTWNPASSNHQDTDQGGGWEGNKPRIMAHVICSLGHQRQEDHHIVKASVA